MDTIEILGLKINAHIGVYAFEHQITQPLIIDIVFTTEFEKCEDNIEKTLDYALICQQVADIIQSQHFNLIETVAQTLALSLKKTWKPNQIKVSVSKPSAQANVRDIKVTVTR